MSDARSQILQRLRANSVHPSRTPPTIPVRRYDWDPVERFRRFRDRMEAVRGEVHQVGPDWPQRIHELLRDKGGGNLLYGPQGPQGPELERAWPASDAARLIPYPGPLETCRDILFQDMDASFTGCLGAIAETGSLALWPTPQEPRLLSLIAPIHFVLLDAAQIYTSFHELLTEQAWQAHMPSNALLISGPSKSADIEQTLAYGVHGPKALIVLVRGAKTLAKNDGPS